MQLVKKLLAEPDEYGVKISTTDKGTTIVDAGVEANGGYLAGKAVTEICLGGYGKAEIHSRRYGDLELPSIHVYTDHPAVATLGSQLAGWRIKVGNYRAIASGPARALALKPKELYAKIDYRDDSDSAVIVLESSTIPNEAVVEYVADKCGVAVDKLCVIVVPTASIAGLTQISGRVVETALHKLVGMGFDPRTVLYGSGYAPIAPLHPNSIEAMGRANDMLLYGGVVYLTVEYSDKKEKLKEIVENIPSIASKDYGRPFAEIFKSVGRDFYKIDPHLFAPAVVVINNVTSGNVLGAGRINVEIIKKSILS